MLNGFELQQLHTLRKTVEAARVEDAGAADADSAAAEDSSAVADDTTAVASTV